MFLVLSIILCSATAWSDSRGVRLTNRTEQNPPSENHQPSDTPSFHGTRRALVIGNSRYLVSPLRNAAHDAEDIARTLQGLGFAVTKAIDADKEAMLAAISRFGSELGPGDIGLFYYAGHGMQINGKNYLLPVDVGMIYSQGEVPYKAVNAQLVMDRIEGSGNRMSLVILDACRDNPFASGESRPRGLAQMDAPNGTLIVYATKPGSTAEDGVGRNGIFTKNLLRLIGSSEDVQFMLRKVRSAVIEETQGRQVPWDEGTLVNGFCLATPGTGGSIQEASLQPGYPSEARRPSAAEYGGGQPQNFRRTIGEVEASGTSLNGEMKMVFVSTGASSLADSLSWRIAAEREAMKKVKQAVNELLGSPPFSLSDGRIKQLYQSGKVVDASYADEAKKITVKYQIQIDDRYH